MKHLLNIIVDKSFGSITVRGITRVTENAIHILEGKNENIEQIQADMISSIKEEMKKNLRCSDDELHIEIIEE